MLFRTGNFQFGLLLATMLSASLWPASSQAYTPEQEQACTPDAFRLCGSEIPDVGRVTACMVAKKSQLSPACRAHFRPDAEPREAVVRPAAGRPDRAGERASRSAKPRKAKKPAKPAT